MLPWHTLVCNWFCNQTDSVKNSKSLPQRIAESVKRAYLRDSNNISTRLENWKKDLDFNVREHAPSWVNLLSKMNAEIPSADSNNDHSISDIDNFLNENGLRGVAIIREEPKD